jgi:hypothetical protein
VLQAIEYNSSLSPGASVVIAIENAGIHGLPHIINAVLLVAAWSAENSDPVSSCFVAQIPYFTDTFGFTVCVHASSLRVSFGRQGSCHLLQVCQGRCSTYAVTLTASWCVRIPQCSRSKDTGRLLLGMFSLVSYVHWSDRLFA